VTSIARSLRIIALGLCLCGAAARADPPAPSAATQEAASRPDASLDLLHFKSPPGWKRLEQPADAKDTISYLAPDSTPDHPALISIWLGPPPQEGNLDLHQALEKYIATTLAAYRPDRPLIAPSVDDQGYPAASTRVMAWEPSGAPFFASFYALDINQRPAVISYIERADGGDGMAGYYQRKAAYDQLVAGHVIGDGAAVPGAPLVVGQQPLTLEIVDRSAQRIELALDIKLTADQRELLKKALKQFWVDRVLIRGTYLTELDAWEQAMKRGAGSRRRVLAMLRTRADTLVDFCHRSDEPLAASILASYIQAHGGKTAAPVAPAADDRGGGAAILAAATTTGLPPLTAADARRYADFAEWALGIRLAPPQRQALADQLAREWPRGGWDAQATAATLRASDSLSRLSEADRALIVVYFRANYLMTVQFSIIDSQRLLKKAYEEQHQPLANGILSLYEPPLTREETDAYAELSCFQVNAVVGRRAFEPTPAAKDAAARGLAAGYTDFSLRLKYALTTMPQALAEIRLAWPLLTEEDRAAWRDQWAPWLAPIGVKPGVVPAVWDAAELLELVVRKERSDDDAYKKTPHAGIMAVMQANFVSRRDQAAYNTFINAMRDRYGDAYEFRYGSAPAR
jgi:hypothetical protein